MRDMPEPPSLPDLSNKSSNKPWAVMCCGCRRMMDLNGKPVSLGVQVNAAGFVNIDELKTWDDVAGFATHPDADEAAAKAGWSVKDTAGPNHRCPDCIVSERKKKDQSARRGAYILRPTFSVDSTARAEQEQGAQLPEPSTETGSSIKKESL